MTDFHFRSANKSTTITNYQRNQIPKVTEKYTYDQFMNNISNHTSHGSVSVVRTTFKVYGKKANFDPQPTKNP